MAVALRYPEIMHPVKGIKLASLSAGLKKTGADDMVLIACDAGTQAAAVFTQNAFCAAPVTLARKHLEHTHPRYLLINAGNANAGTGTEGMRNALRCCEQVAEQAGVSVPAVLPFSTGVIGEQLNLSLMQKGIGRFSGLLSEDNWLPASRGIMTTDTAPKGFSERILIDNVEVTVTGMCKGSGMICPNMATMLAFIATDARVDSESLQALLNQANARSFNSISIDGDTSTNDACVLLATGQAGHAIPDNAVLDEQHPQWSTFAACIVRACESLAQSIVRDGEGATKFIEVAVTGGFDVAECRQVAYTIAHSPLVKTAFFASDPNVGRLLAAVGRSGLNGLDIEKVSLAIEDVVIVEKGEPASDYSEARAQAVMNRKEITVFVALGRGDAQWSIWTSDLSYDYLRINAEYRS